MGLQKEIWRDVNGVDSSTAFKDFLRKELVIMRLLLAILWTIATVLRACEVAD